MTERHLQERPIERTTDRHNQSNAHYSGDTKHQHSDRFGVGNTAGSTSPIDVFDIGINIRNLISRHKLKPDRVRSILVHNVKDHREVSGSKPSALILENA